MKLKNELKDKLKTDTMFLLNNHFEYSGSDYDVVSTYLDYVIEDTIKHCAEVVGEQVDPKLGNDIFVKTVNIAREQAKRRLLDLL